VSFRKAKRPQHRGNDEEALALDGIADHVGTTATRAAQAVQVVRAELIDSDVCTALGIRTRGFAPVLGLCRLLLKAGINPAAQVEAWRGKTLCISITSVAYGSALAVDDGRNGTPRFRRWRRRDVRCGWKSPANCASARALDSQPRQKSTCEAAP
jgi:hypothetical protein